MALLIDHKNKTMSERTTSSSWALAIVQARRGTDDAKAYAGFLMDLAQRVTRAASEGGILGFGGERVSEGERVFLSELTEALGWPGERTFAA